LDSLRRFALAGFCCAPDRWQACKIWPFLACFCAGLNTGLNALFCGFFRRFFALGSLRISTKNHVTKCDTDFKISNIFVEIWCKTFSSHAF
jgi:hypothetical protein